MLPASGLRNNSSGALDNVGINGYSWSASPNAVGSANAGFLNFNSNGNVNPLHGDVRSYGFPVRCARGFMLLGRTIFLADDSGLGFCFADVRFVGLSNVGSNVPLRGTATVSRGR